MTTPDAHLRTSSVLRAAAAAILVMNLLDAAFTLVWTLSGLAVEANPLMDLLLSISPIHFMSTKLALVSLGLLLLWRLRWRRTARVAIVGSALAYAALLTYHLNAVPQLVALLG
jgi:hypothetical protein